MKRLDTEQIKWLHSEIIKASGGSGGLRDEGLLESAVLSPFHSFDGVDCYPSFLEKAARLGYNLISNHPFVDGNKRAGLHAMLVFLALNGTELEYKDEDLIKTIFDTASGKLRYDGLLEWVKAHLK